MHQILYVDLLLSCTFAVGIRPFVAFFAPLQIHSRLLLQRLPSARLPAPEHAAVACLDLARGAWLPLNACDSAASIRRRLGRDAKTDARRLAMNFRCLTGDERDHEPKYCLLVRILVFATLAEVCVCAHTQLES